MSAYAADLWGRATKALLVARRVLSVDPDAAASRAYYAAFYAVSAHFALANRTFSRRSAVETAVHRDLVQAGIWPKDLGAGYSRLVQLRARGDYGGTRHVSAESAEEAIAIAARVLNAVARANPDSFRLTDAC